MNKNPMLAFFLAVIPGFGHLYWGRTMRAVIYMIGFLASIGLFAIALASNEGDIALFAFIVGIVVWVVNMLDMIITLISTHRILVQPTQAGHAPSYDQGGTHHHSELDPELSMVHRQQPNERFNTILLSLIPGLGHFHLGLMNRGIAFLSGFFGLMIMIIFVGILTRQEGFLIFLGVLPVIWLYCLFDAIQLLNRKQRGEILEDRTLFEDFEQHREEGKKSKAIAMLISVFPGAGHMYLGLQRRGLQLMAAFLLSIYILDVLRLSLFLFLIPLIWFFSFFDALQQVSKHGREELRDVPIIAWLSNHQKWIGIGLLVLGGYYLLDQVIVPALDPLFQRYFHISTWYHRFFQTTVVSILLIGGGIKLLAGSKASVTEQDDPSENKDKQDHQGGE